MAEMTYSQQLKHPNWQRRRLEMLNKANFKCSDCGADEITLHVHHKQYFKGRMAWEYSNDELQVLCEVCHEEAHAVADKLKALLASVDQAQVLALLTGFYSQADWIEPSIINAGFQDDPLTYAAGFTASITSHLGITGIHDVAKYAASLTMDTSEARLILDSCNNIFGGD